MGDLAEEDSKQMLLKKEIETRERYLNTLKTSHEDLSFQLKTMLEVDE